MNVKSYVDVEIVKNERVYHFLMPVGAPFGEAYDSAFEVLSSITEMAKNAAEQARPVDAEGKPADSAVVDAELVN